jgi:methylthioribulose-1-phosphate dehydratase
MMAFKKSSAPDRTTLTAVARQLAELGRQFYSRGWTLGTSGNFSAVLSEDPLSLAITASGLDKGRLDPADLLKIDSEGILILEGKRRVAGHRLSGKTAQRRPSDETRLHLAIVRARQARAVLHTHSVWATIVSERYAARRGVLIEGYEMLKGLEGVYSHKDRVWLPILENSQDMPALAHAVIETLDQHPGAHGLLLRGHGLYTWGRDLATAKRHVEILEFLVEVVGRSTG